MAEQFDIMGSGYEATLISHPHIRSEEVSHILGAINLKSHHTILDYAAGSGFLTQELAKRIGAEGRVIAVDTSEVMLGLLREKTGGSDFVGCVRTNDPTLTSIPSGSIDRITSLGGFHHVEDQVSVTRALYRLLRQGGLALILDFGDGTPAQEHFDGLVSKYNPTGHPALFLSKSRAANLAKFAGCHHATVTPRRFTWRFKDADDIGSFFVRHHGLSCNPREARDRVLATFRLTEDKSGPINIKFDYIELMMRKPG